MVALPKQPPLKLKSVNYQKPIISTPLSWVLSLVVLQGCSIFWFNSCSSRGSNCPNGFGAQPLRQGVGSLGFQQLRAHKQTCQKLILQKLPFGSRRYFPNMQVKSSNVFRIPHLEGTCLVSRRNLIFWHILSWVSIAEHNRISHCRTMNTNYYWFGNSRSDICHSTSPRVHFVRIQRNQRYCAWLLFKKYILPYSINNFRN